MKNNTLITISRQYGSGGKEIAELLAQKMGVRCYDRQILYMAAEKMGNSDMDIETILEMSYRVPENTMGGFMDGVNSLGYETIPSYNKMYREQAKIIRDIAGKGSAVFLGRCADAVLEDFEDCYNFFLYADAAFREQHARQSYGIQSVKELEKETRTRERYYNYYTGKKWGDPINYDLMINTGTFSAQKAAELIFHYVNSRQES